MSEVNLNQRKEYWRDHPEIWNTPCPKCDELFMSDHGARIHLTKKHNTKNPKAHFEKEAEEILKSTGNFGELITKFSKILEKEYHLGWLRGMREGKQIGYLRRKQVEKSGEN